MDFVARTGTQSRLREDGLRQSHRLSPGGALLTGATGACGLWILQAGQGRSPASGKTVCGNRTVYPPVARYLPGLRERAVFGFCSLDRDVVPPPGRRSAAIAPFIPRWRVAYRGYGSVRSLDFAGRTGTQPRLREDGLRQSHRLSPGGALLTGATGACDLWIL